MSSPFLWRRFWGVVTDLEFGLLLAMMGFVCATGPSFFIALFALTAGWVVCYSHTFLCPLLVNIDIVVNAYY